MNAQKCISHDSRPVEFYCSSHKQQCCDTCINQHHRLCKEVLKLNTFAKKSAKLEDFQNISKRLNIVNSKTKQILREAGDKLKLIDQNYEELVNAVKETRKELNETLDRIEAELLKEAQKMKENNLQKVKEVMQKFQQIEREVEALVKQAGNMDALKKTRDSFIRSELTESKLKAAEDIIIGKDNSIHVEGFTFLPNASTQTLLQQTYSMGKYYHKLWAEHETDVTSRTIVDKGNAWITGSAALPGMVVLCDYGNSKIKVINSDNLTVHSELLIVSSPWAVAKVQNRKVAITVPGIKKILIMKIDDNFPSTEKEIGTTSRCHGIAHLDGKLIVTFNKKDRVEIIDMSGNVLQTISPEVNGKKLLSFPEYVTVSSSNQTMYISNYVGNSVVSLGLDGKVIGVFQHADLVQPRQTTMDSNGILFICGYGSNNVMLMSQDLRRVKTLLGKSDNVLTPRTICLSETGNRLFMDLSPNLIRVFHVSSNLTERKADKAEKE